MDNSVFLSASVPDPKRNEEYARTADIVAITSAVSALIHVTLGRRSLVWGGHPAITPMIWLVAQEMGVDYEHWVKLYQSRYFEDEYPEDNDRFHNVVYTSRIDDDREKSLQEMRMRMFSDNNYSAGVFIGGMSGIIDEYLLFRKYQPRAKILPVVSTGGAVLEVAAKIGEVASDLQDDFDYVRLFHKHLSISVREKRYSRPELQPSEIEQRFWHHSS